MKIPAEHTTPELSSLQPAGRLRPGNIIPLAPAEKIDDAPC
ncbi:MAG: hypothetical protein SCH71_04505 [Desulfobulbaceae bacterium]|nr:hypothetical protein [Desulfobulbaceae bacterium]